MRADGRHLTLAFDDLEVNCVSTQVTLDSEDADRELVTFADVVSGNDKRWSFTITAVADYAAGSFWDMLWVTPAYQPIDYEFAPYGNTTPNVDQPHFTGQVTVDRRPPIGGDAGAPWWTFDARLVCTANPTRVTS